MGGQAIDYDALARQARGQDIELPPGATIVNPADLARQTRGGGSPPPAAPAIDYDALARQAQEQGGGTPPPGIELPPGATIVNPADLPPGATLVHGPAVTAGDRTPEAQNFLYRTAEGIPVYGHVPYATPGFEAVSPQPPPTPRPSWEGTPLGEAVINPARQTAGAFTLAAAGADKLLANIAQILGSTSGGTAAIGLPNEPGIREGLKRVENWARGQH
jgi:hypothetical protein